MPAVLEVPTVDPVPFVAVTSQTIVYRNVPLYEYGYGTVNVFEVYPE
jgi:hypothetical protein